MAKPYWEFAPVKKGNIYSAEGPCPACGVSYQHVDRRGVLCPKCGRPALKIAVKFGKEIYKRFNDYPSALTFLSHLRAEAGSDNFDVRDYQVKEKPLSFSVLAKQWLAIKKQTRANGTYVPLKSYMDRACEAWGDRNIKNIGYGDVEDFIHGLTNPKTEKPLADKTKHNCLMSLKAFWAWCRKRHGIEMLQDWPEVRYTMSYRNTTDLETQTAILAAIKDLYRDNPRVWLGCHLLATYISVRPKEMWSLQERHVDRDRGVLMVEDSKGGQPKLVPLTDDDLALVRTFDRGLPNTPFFRYDRSPKYNLPAGSAIGPGAFYRAWKKGCKAVGVQDLDLYGGTKHSTAMSLRQVATFEEVRTMTMHATNKAFERYFRTEGDALKDLYARRQTIGQKQKTADVIELRKTGNDE